MTDLALQYVQLDALFREKELQGAPLEALLEEFDGQLQALWNRLSDAERELLTKLLNPEQLKIREQDIVFRDADGNEVFDEVNRELEQFKKLARGSLFKVIGDGEAAA